MEARDAKQFVSDSVARLIRDHVKRPGGPQPPSDRDRAAWPLVRGATMLGSGRQCVRTKAPDARRLAGPAGLGHQVRRASQARIERNPGNCRVVAGDVRVPQGRDGPVALVSLVAEHPPGIDVPQIREAFFIHHRRVVEIRESPAQVIAPHPVAHEQAGHNGGSIELVNSTIA